MKAWNQRILLSRISSVRSVADSTTGSDQIGHKSIIVTGQNMTSKKGWSNFK